MIKNFADLPLVDLEDFKILAIHEIDPDAGFSIINGVMTWDESNKNEKPSDEDIEKKALELQTLHKNLEHARIRKPLYPEIGDQLDDLYKNGAFSDEMTAKIKKVKDDNPKS